LQTTSGSIASVAAAAGNPSASPNVTANRLTLAAPGNVQLAYAAQLVDAAQVLGLVSSASGVLPTVTPPATTIAAAQVAAASVQSVMAAVFTPSFAAPLLLPAPTVVVDPTVVGGLTTLTVDPVTGAVIQTAGTGSSTSTSTSTSPSAGAAPTTTAGTASTPAADVIAMASTVYINVANSVIQKPVDQIIITDKPRAQSLVCR
jgi:hypothetical protein